jgi:hypothetical protein
MRPSPQQYLPAAAVHSHLQADTKAHEWTAADWPLRLSGLPACWGQGVDQVNHQRAIIVSGWFRPPRMEGDLELPASADR